MESLVRSACEEGSRGVIIGGLSLDWEWIWILWILWIRYPGDCCLLFCLAECTNGQPVGSLSVSYMIGMFCACVCVLSGGLCILCVVSVLCVSVLCL